MNFEQAQQKGVLREWEAALGRAMMIADRKPGFEPGRVSPSASQRRSLCVYGPPAPMASQLREARKRTACRLFDEGRTRVEVAAALGINRSAFEDWLRNNRIEAPGSASARAQQRQATITRMVDAGLSREDIRAVLGISRTALRAALARWANATGRTPPPGSKSGRARNTARLAAIAQLAAEIGVCAAARRLGLSPSTVSKAAKRHREETCRPGATSAGAAPSRPRVANRSTLQSVGPGGSHATSGPSHD